MCKGGDKWGCHFFAANYGERNSSQKMDDGNLDKSCGYF